ncbi:Hypothetical_protein [Hexamita inflata]|uniref:Hypothetical_protein n=1 Tax=Hexamita inflata TaxID=28002 RepID=A0AA86RP61_9EUKA|nr:Hypothetical protein HINF_LOCUS63144 [Hexamita inflata]
MQRKLHGINCKADDKIKATHDQKSKTKTSSSVKPKQFQPHHEYDQHTDLFDIQEVSVANYNNNTNKTKIKKQCQQQSISSNKTKSQYLFWDESSKKEVKILHISTSNTGNRNVEEIVISTSKYKDDIDTDKDDLFSFIF